MTVASQLAGQQRESLDRSIRRWRETSRGEIPGLSIAVIRDGNILKQAGYGMANLELQVPATKETVYEIGSISKQFAAEINWHDGN